MSLLIDKKPLVSVIVPAYNAGVFLHRTVESVLRQSYANWELILVNDGSQDNTLAIARAYADKDPRIRVVDQLNQGESGSRKNGLRAAKGEWVLFLDADDLFGETTIEILLGQPEDASMVFGATVYARPNNEIIGRQSVRINGLGVNALYPLIFSFRMPQAIWGKLIRKEIADQIQWPSRAIKIGGDALSLFSILPLCQRIYAVSEDTHYYIQHDHSIMAQKSAEAVASMRQYLQGIYRMVSELSPELRLLGYRYVLLEYYAYLIYGGGWDLSFVWACVPHAKLPMKAELLFGSYKRSAWLGDRVRGLLRFAGASKKLIAAKMNSIGGWFSAL